jgi:hypothetical protein
MWTCKNERLVGERTPNVYRSRTPQQEPRFLKKYPGQSPLRARFG